MLPVLPRKLISFLFVLASFHASADPHLDLSSTYLIATTNLGDSVDAPLTLTNSGNVALTYNIPNAGYLKVDSDQPNGPVYSWLDISASGTAITGLGDEGNAGPIDLGFSFPFYDQNFSSFRLSANGFLSFSSAIPSSSAYINTPLPSPNNPATPNLLAFFWDDLDFSSSGAAHYKRLNTSTFVLQFKDVPFYGSSTKKVSCQLYLQNDGVISLNYQRVDTANTCTVGIQNATRDVGTQVVYNAPYLRPNFAVWLEQHQGAPWMIIPPADRSGTVNAGASRQLLVPLDAAGLQPGIHTAILKITSNDPGAATVQVPVILTVRLLLAQWKANFFSAAELANPSISDATQDPDGDGLSNGLEFALRSDPRVASLANLPTPSEYQNAGQRYLSLRFVRSQSTPEQTLVPEVSPDLSNWFSGPTQIEELSVTDRGDGTEWVVVRDLTPLAATGKRFMRLKAELQQEPNAPTSGGVLTAVSPAGLSATAVTGNKTRFIA